MSAAKSLPKILERAKIPTLAAWAHAAGISWATLREIRRGKRRLTPRVAQLLGDAIGVPTSSVRALVMCPTNRGRPRGSGAKR